MNYIRTFSGIPFPTVPDARFVSITDIAHGLAMAPRWGGHSKVRYSVVAHSIFVSLLVPPALKYQALLHDASEAYFCDIPKPFKDLLPDYRRIENAFMTEIAKALRFDFPLAPEIKKADAVALYLERKNLFTFPVGIDVPKVTIKKLPKWDFIEWANKTPEELEKKFLNYVQLYSS